jgi:hypothetical protein
VRLRPEFANLYPGLDPGVWETATELMARLLAQHAVQPSPGVMLSNRILPDQHFEFQGGSPRDSAWSGLRSRATDKGSGAMGPAQAVEPGDPTHRPSP